MIIGFATIFDCTLFLKCIYFFIAALAIDIIILVYNVITIGNIAPYPRDLRVNAFKSDQGYLSSLLSLKLGNIPLFDIVEQITPLPPQFFF